MTKKEFIKQYKSAMKQGYKYIGEGIGDNGGRVFAERLR